MEGRGLGSVLSPADSSSPAKSQAEVSEPKSLPDVVEAESQADTFEQVLEEEGELFLRGVSSKTSHVVGWVCRM